MADKSKNKNPVGRPSKFELYEKVILNIAKYGLTDKQIASAVGIDESSLNNWKKDNPKFFESLKEAKEESDRSVVKSLYERANGYNINETTKELRMTDDGEKELVVTKVVTKHIVPDTTAQIFWLKNRQPDKWRDKQELEHSGELNIKIDWE
jgi:transcriptional regulator with XRE-family HTH domain